MERNLSKKAREVIKNGISLKQDSYTLAGEACELNAKCIEKQEDIINFIRNMGK